MTAFKHSFHMGNAPCQSIIDTWVASGHKNHGDKLLIQIKWLDAIFSLLSWRVCNCCTSNVQVSCVLTLIGGIPKISLVLKILNSFFLWLAPIVPHKPIRRPLRWSKWLAAAPTTKIYRFWSEKRNRTSAAARAMQTVTGRMQWTHVKITNQENKSHFFASLLWSLLMLFVSYISNVTQKHKLIIWSMRSHAKRNKTKTKTDNDNSIDNEKKSRQQQQHTQ